MDFKLWGGPYFGVLGCGSCMEPTPGPGGSSSTRKSRRIREKHPKFSKNPKIFENFPVAPGRSLGYPGSPTGKFSKNFGFFENFGFFSLIFLDFSSSSSGSSSSTDFQHDYKIAYKPILEPITGLRHYSSWIRLVFLCRFVSSIRFLAL